MARNFADELSKLTQQSHKLQEEGGSGGINMIYPGRFIGSHSFRIFWSTKSSNLIRLLDRMYYIGADGKPTWTINLKSIGEKSETLDLVRTLKDNNMADLSGNYYTTQRAIFFGQFVSSTNPELTKELGPGWKGVVMMSKTLYKSLIAAISEGSTPESYQKLTTSYVGPTITLTRGDTPTAQSASMSFKEFQTAPTQEEMDLFLDSLGNLDELYYHSTPTDEEVTKARETDLLFSTELRAKYLGGSPQSLSPQQLVGTTQQGNSSVPDPSKVPPIPNQDTGQVPPVTSGNTQFNNPTSNATSNPVPPAGVDAMQNASGYNPPKPPKGWNPNQQ